MTIIQSGLVMKKKPGQERVRHAHQRVPLLSDGPKVLENII